ncbi:MAG: DUF1028 domain-containing protein [Chloroflexota bacterium]
MTLSLGGLCVETGMVGAVITTSSPCVGARCLWVGSNQGVVLTQNVTNPALGPAGLAKMGDGVDAEATLAHLLAIEPHPSYRQLALVDREGGTASFSGENALGVYTTAAGKNCVAAGNLLDNTDVPSAMVAAFESSAGHLANRLLDALKAGIAAGGEAGPVHSAALTVCHTQPWPIADLRVDWHDDPVSQLQVVWDVYQPQMADYILRAHTPSDAPSYGVPGDE